MPLLLRLLNFTRLKSPFCYQVFAVILISGFPAKSHAIELLVYTAPKSEIMSAARELIPEIFGNNIVSTNEMENGYDVRLRYFVDFWRTRIVIDDVAATMTDGRVVRGVTVSVSGSGSSFLRGQGAQERFERTFNEWLSAHGRPRLVDSAYIEWGSEQPAQLDEGPRTTSQGTAFVIGSGLRLVTANHVIDGAARIEIFCGGDGPIAARTELRDAANDLAVLRVDAPLPNPLRFTTEFRVGQRVFTVGYPVPDVLGFEPKVTDGVINSTTGLGGSANTIQISTPVQPGNSGGPLIDENGQVLGVITSAAAFQAFVAVTGSIPQNVNWAVKSRYALALLSDLGEVQQVGEPIASLAEAVSGVCMVTTFHH